MAWLGVFVAPPRAIAQDKMRMGLSSVSALHSAMWIAEQKGLFHKHGIDAESLLPVKAARPASARCSLTIFK
jgi:ABC-type nitrate/sulfonate/bicarbonate transport system substrate-binding protein